MGVDSTGRSNVVGSVSQLQQRRPISSCHSRFFNIVTKSGIQFCVGKELGVYISRSFRVGVSVGRWTRSLIRFYRELSERSCNALGGPERNSIMSRQTFILCVFAVLLQWQPWSVVSATFAPPKGYSAGFTATIARGTQKYTCNQGSWIKTGSSADLLAADGSKLGSYRTVYNPATRKSTYNWNIINTAGGYYESGQRESGLQATAVKSANVYSSAVTEYLAIVKVHRGAGDASQVAFVSLSGTKGGMPPRKGLCSSYGATSGVPFQGTFTFYNQDRQPPQVPASLTAKGSFLQVVFLEGKVVYKFLQGRWRYIGIFATISDVAGGVVLGKFGTVNKADKFGSKLLFQFKDPNGFFIYGRNCAKPVRMSADGFHWQLMKITTSGGTVSPLGKYTEVLMGGTMGGLAPRIAAKTYGMTWSSPFTAQCYLYTA